MTDENLELCRDQLVEAMLVHVPFDGWTWSALEAGATLRPTPATSAQSKDER